MQKRSIEGQGEINSLLVFSNLKYIYPIALTIFIIPSVLCNLNLKTHNEQKISRWTNVSITPFLTVNVVFKFYRQSNYHFTQNYNFAARKYNFFFTENIWR